MSNPREAERRWRKVRELDLEKSDQAGWMEYILAHYYLGDPEGAGLGMVLETLRRERSAPWILFFLAGLGWAVRGDLRIARNDLRLAVLRHKTTADGVKLSLQLWQVSRGLFNEEAQAQLAEFFEQVETRAER
jgi:hypothetical protein